MNKTIIYVAMFLGGTAFLGMVKLMYDMTGHMARMTDQVAVMTAEVGRMSTHMGTLVEQVAGIQHSVQHMAALAEDVHGLRESVGAMAGIVRRGGEQIEQLNPAQMLQQMMDPQQRR